MRGLLLHCSEVLTTLAGEVHSPAKEHVTALGYCWCHGLPCDAVTLVALQRVAARICAKKGVPMGYEDNPDFSGEGITFRHDILHLAARELELEPESI